MRSVVPVGLATTIRLGVVGTLMAVSAGCSSDITRFSSSFFNDPGETEVTGALGVVPSETVPGQARVRDAQPVPVAGGPLAPAGQPRIGGDGYSVVRAEPGDTAYSLSRRYGVSARDIMVANDMQSAVDVRAGQDVRIPPIGWKAEGGGVSTASVRPAPVQAGDSLKPLPSASARAAARAPAGDRIHTVGAGETLSGIGRAYGMRASDIARHNNLESADRLRVGQKLAIPGAAPVRTASLTDRMNDATPAPAPKPRTPAVREPRPAAPATTADRAAPEPTPVRTAALETGEKTISTRLSQPPALSSSKFRWPVRGRIISEFGKKPNGAQNDGINVAVPEGTSVKAAENGVVAYVGNELKGFGNLILVRHADDWVSAYAHNSQILVRRGDMVSRGQIIAKAGQTGSVRQPQLHFELRKGSRPVDPIQHLADNS